MAPRVDAAQLTLSSTDREPVPTEPEQTNAPTTIIDDPDLVERLSPAAPKQRRRRTRSDALRGRSPLLVFVLLILIPIAALRPSGAALSVEGALYPTAEVEVVGTGFDPGAAYTLLWNGAPVVAPPITAAADGSFRVILEVPHDAEAGRHIVAAAERASAPDPARPHGPVRARVAVDVEDWPDTTVIARPSGSPHPIVGESPPASPQPSSPVGADELDDVRTARGVPARDGDTQGVLEPDAPAAPAAVSSLPGQSAAPVAPPPAPSTPAPAPSSPPPAAPPPSGAAFYVATGGSDGASGSASQPWRTLAHAAKAAPAGATIYVRGGSYASATVTRSGLSFVAYPGEVPVVEDGMSFRGVSSGRLEGFTLQGDTGGWGSGISVEEASNVALVRNVVRGNTLGIYLLNARAALVEHNEITDNAMGIEVHQATDGTVIRHNRVYDNDRFLDSSRSAGGVNFWHTHGGLTLAGNTIADNDEVAIEIYAAADLLISDNVLTGSHDLIETGTEQGVPCSNLTIVRNVGYHSGSGTQRGFYLRCASHSLVAHNTLDGLDAFAFGVNHGAGPFAGSVEGLRIVNNVAVNGRVFGIDTWPLPASVVIDHNLAWNPGSSADWGEYLAYVVNVGNTSELATFQGWTGYEAHGISADPRFVNRAGRDYRLAAGSPAIDRALKLAGVNDAFAGAAPDLGRHER